MKATNSRRTLGSVVASLDWAVALLARAEHGADRQLIAAVRKRLASASAELLVLRAHVGACENSPPTTARVDSSEA
jgi:hypothetical protein